MCVSVCLCIQDTQTHTQSIIQSLIKTFDGLYVFVLFFYILPPDEETRCVTQSCKNKIHVCFLLHVVWLHWTTKAHLEWNEGAAVGLNTALNSGI